MLHAPRPMPHDFRDAPTSHPVAAALTPEISASKPIKKKNNGHVRRQNRSCDQCRKGKRRCDAAVLRDREDGTQYEDYDWDFDSSTRDPAPCTYCTKTKKQCTFEWLRSQESQLKLKKDVSKAAAIKPTKRVKAEDNTSSGTYNTGSQSEDSTSPDTVDHADFINGASTAFSTEAAIAYPSIDAGLQSYAFTTTPFSLSSDSTFPTQSYNQAAYAQPGPFSDFCSDTTLASELPSPSTNVPWNQFNSNDISFLRPKPKRALLAFDEYTNDEYQDTSNALRVPLGLIDPSPLALSERLTRSVNHHLVSEGLMKIYHDSLETALSCWLAERTCPYLNKTKMITATTGDPTTEKFNHVSTGEAGLNTMFKRVYKLDRMAGRIRTRPLSQYEEMQASKALYLTIMAFATQWSQGSNRSREEHVLPSAHQRHRYNRSQSASSNGSSYLGDQDFDRQLQESYWHEARQALLLCAETESFKVAFANIIFSFTQKPLDATLTSKIRQKSALSPAFNGEAFNLQQIEDEVDRVLAEDGPPMYFEQGIRNAHTLRDRLMRLERELEGTGVKLLDDEDRTTVDLIAWLGYMGDTLVSTVLQRPLVVSDENCDVLPEAVASLKLSDEEDKQRPGVSKLWSDFIFMQERFNRGNEPLRFPCSYDQAAAGLTDAAPIKVLLYRKVQAIQNLVSRHALATSIEEAIQEAKGAYHHWKVVYEPFIQDLIEHHESLHPRLQSWYICLTAHHYLATLLFADAMDQVDSASLGLNSHCFHRQSGNVVPHIRRHSALLIASVAHRATPHENASFAASGYHHAMSAGALLTEPWTALLIRAFFKATILLLQDAASPAGQGEARSKLIRSAEECVRAIQYLGRKSDTAVLAGEMLSTAIRNQEQASMASSFVQQESAVELDNLKLFDDLCNDNIPQEFELFL